MQKEDGLGDKKRKFCQRISFLLTIFFIYVKIPKYFRMCRVLEVENLIFVTYLKFISFY